MKSCFLICPIGKPGSEIRLRSDQILKHVIEPVTEKCGYSEPVRADRLAKPGLITSQIIERIYEDDLVISDLTGGNPNVFYELAIRHALKKPAIQLIKEGERIPFDVAMSRTIEINHTNLDSVEAAKNELERQIKAVEADPENVDNPISISLDIRTLRVSGDPFKRSVGELTSEVGSIRAILQPLDRAQTFQVLEQKIDALDRLLSRFKVDVDLGGAYDLDDIAGKVDEVESKTSDLERLLEKVDEKVDELVLSNKAQKK